MRTCIGDVRDERVPLRAELVSGDPCALGRVGGGSRFAKASLPWRRVRIGAVVTLTTAAIWLVAAATASAFSAHGSVEQVYVTGLAPSAQMSLQRWNGETVSTQTADSLGGLLFRDVAPGSGYRVRLSSTREQSGPITVHTQSAAPWDPGIYKQSIPDSGYTYLTTRDGTQLAIDVHPPGIPSGVFGSHSNFQLPASAAASSASPYPTIIEYSGYGYANPAGPESGIAELANLMGFAVVDVNMRGTGCSGGAFDFFEPLENLDAYDVIQTIASQPWVLGHKVGMLGISYGGISQLFAAQLRPPALEAIAPLSVLDATATTLYPGGILNTGFAVPWAEERQHDAEPAGPASGEHWAYEQIQTGDETCAGNQDLHGEATNLLAEINENATYNPSVADRLDPVTLVHNIDVPTFMACQWEDEQTGGHCADLAEHFTGTERKWFTFTNGAHIDSLDPYTLDRLYDFLELFVAHQAPIYGRTILTHLAAPIFYKLALGVPAGDIVTLPPDPVQKQLLYANALATFTALPEIRVLFDNGAGTSPTGVATPGNPYPAFEQSFSAFPIPGTTARSWYLGAEGTLGEQPPTAPGVDSYSSDASATPLTDYSSNTGLGGLWSDASVWEWNWEQPTAGSAVSYVSAPLTSDTTAIGAGAVNLWVQSSTPDVDLQATVSEVRPDGNETFVQNGWIRASERKLATTSTNMLDQAPTPLQPIPTFLASDVQPMPAHEFVPVTIPLYFEGHVYRAGSRIRVTIAAPNGTQPVWSFSRTQPEGTTANVSIAFGPGKPANLTLPIVPGVTVPTGLPPCPSLRNEPCRPYQAFVNDGS
ncbi:MAG TPA: CocE/NonD family hydrolase [Solirubrobacteraceae bacterium]|nr:CocE/NonD family hydrolase [Solirubrobacteraceae bacterium]